MNEDVEEALARARKHLRSATFEGLEAASALLDAALRTTGIDDTDPRSFAGELRMSLDDLRTAVQTEGALRFPSALADPLLAALDAEIARWEQRSANDATSRPVLRAFLALREFLWEMGIRQKQAEAAETGSGEEAGAGAAWASARFGPEAPGPAPPVEPSARRTRERVQRFEVE